jgi:hypothetical protein
MRFKAIVFVSLSYQNNFFKTTILIQQMELFLEPHDFLTFLEEKKLNSGVPGPALHHYFFGTCMLKH